MISDFQLVLVGIIAVIIVGVVVYNRWQEAKYKRRAESAFSAADRDDALFNAPGPAADRVEPSFRGMDADEAAALEELTRPIGTVPCAGSGSAIGGSGVDVDARDTHVGRPIVRGSAAELQPSINPEIDSVATMLADAPVDADTHAPVIAESAEISRHIVWEGMTGGLWQVIDPTLDVAYRELRAGLQLADRAGATDETTIAAFHEAMGRYAMQLGAVAQREDVSEASRRAQMVDQLCAETDIEVAINVQGKNGVTFAATKLRGLAEAQGLRALPSGEYALHDDYGRVLFTLRNGNPQEALGLRGEQPYFTMLSFALDVPRTPSPNQNFERMFTLALQFADVLHGEVVDDNKRILTANGRKVIGETIHGIVGEMQARNVVPGSAVALRLYA
jgi:FtsZ-interacting cell division protein ZipA